MTQEKSRWISLSECLAKATIYGQAKPLDWLIDVLRRGKLTARSDYIFKAFRQDELFEITEEAVDIPPYRWEELAAALREKRTTVTTWLLYDEKIKLPNVILNVPDNIVGFCSATGNPLTDGYEETSYGASFIHIWEDDLLYALEGFPERPWKTFVVKPNSGGRPPKPYWEQALIHLFGKIYRDGWKPETIEEVNSELQNWLVNEGADVSDTASRERARALFRALKAWDSAES